MRYFLFLVVFLSCSNCFGQKTFGFDTSVYHYSLSGYVTEMKSKLPIPGATIKLIGSDNSMAEVKTDNSGRYLFPVGSVKPHTSYVVSASALDVKSKGCPDGCLGNPKGKITTREEGSNVSFHQDFVLAKFVKVDYSPVVVFKKDKVELDLSSSLELENMVRLLENNPNITVELIGHAGTMEKNAENLAKQRANLIKDYLVKRNIAIERLSVSGTVQADSVFIKEESYAEHFNEFFSVEQFRTRVFLAIRRTDYPVNPSGVPQIKMTESEGGDTDPGKK